MGIIEDLVYWLALQGFQNKFDVSTLPVIIDKFGKVSNFFHASTHELEDIGWSKNLIDSFFDYANLFSLEKYINLLNEIEQQNIKIITYIDAEYPAQLKRAKTKQYEPPVLLLVKGMIGDLSKCAAIVGNRNATHKARVRAYNLAFELADDGYTIASGLAHGIDYMAHLGALDSDNGRTIATLAWHHPIYPPENADLASDIEKRGAVISELLYCPRDDSEQRRYARSRFVVRNRIISGISDFVVAVESGVSGGTIHQVDLALSQNVPVFTLKPADENLVDKINGFKRMVRMGAKEVENINDLFNTPHFKQIKLDA